MTSNELRQAVKTLKEKQLVGQALKDYLSLEISYRPNKNKWPLLEPVQPIAKRSRIKTKAPSPQRTGKATKRPKISSQRPHNESKN